MKNRILLGFLLIVLLGCSKDDDDSQTPISNNPGCNNCTPEEDTIYTVLDGYLGTWAGSTIASNDGNIINVGRSTSWNDHRMLVIKTNTVGDVIFSKEFHEANSEALKVYEDSNQNIYVVGYSEEANQSNKRKLLAAKLDKDGNVIWEKSYHTQEDITGYHVSGLNLNEIMISGSRDGDLFFLKIDSMGQELMYRVIDPTPSYRVPSSMLVLNDSNILITGHDENGIYLMCYNQEANLLWKKSFGTAYAVGRSTIQLSDGSLVTVGNNTHLKEGSNQIDSMLAIVIKTDSNGELIWEKEVGSVDLLNHGQSIAENEDGSFVFTGYALKNEKTDHMLIYVDSEGNEINSKYFTDDFTFRGDNIVKVENGRNVITGGYQGGIFFLNVDNYGVE
jgi:hypothetical protein